MKNNLFYTFLMLIISSLSLNAQQALINYEVYGQITSYENAITGACWENGTEEWTAYATASDNGGGSASTGCMTIDNNGNAQYNINFYSRTNSSANTATMAIDAWEDDNAGVCGQTRCSFRGSNASCGFLGLTTAFGDDCRRNESQSYNFINYDFPRPNTVAYYGPTWGSRGDHEYRLAVSWRYTGNSSSISPACASQTTAYSGNGIRSWSANLTAGRTYRFSTVGLSPEDTYIRIYGSDGFTIVAQNDDFGGVQSQVDFTAPSNGTYYIEISRYSRNFLQNNGSLLYQDITTPSVNGGTIASNRTICTGGNASLTSSAAASGGFDGNLSLQWESSNNGTNWTTISGATSATYNTGSLSSTTYYRRKATDCKGTAGYSNTVTVTVVADPTVSLSATAETICTGGSSTLNATASGGTGTISYQWQQFIGGSWQSISGSGSSYLVSPTANTDYKVLVSTGVSGCNGNATQTIAVVADPTVSINATNVSCLGGSNGAASATVSGGTIGNSYNFDWAPGTPSGDGTSSINNLSAGSYTLAISGANGCDATGTVNITEPTALSASSTSGSITCNGGSTTVTVSATGGTAPYSGTGTFTVSAGTYSYTVTDANGCSSTTSITVSEPTALTSSSTSGSISCNGGSTIVTVSAAGGTAPYSGTGTFTVTAGTYNYTVTDANGCSSTTSITVSEPTALSTSSNSGTITCNGGSTTVTVNATGGTAPYNGTGTFTVTAGTYSYTVTDANGCNSTTSITVTEPTALSASISSNVPNSTICNGGSVALTASVDGGLGSVSYQWQYQDNNGNWVNVSGWSGTSSTPFTNTRTASPSQTRPYRIVVTSTIDAQCSVTASQLITVVADPVFTISSTNVSCFGANDGTATAVLTGGLPLNYGINWSSNDGISSNNNPTGDGTLSVSGLFPAEWVVNTTASPSYGCFAQASVIITEPTLLVASSSSGTITCFGGTTTVTVTATGGTAPYNGTGTFTVTAGTYSYTITDANGCTSTTSITVTEPTELTASISSNVPNSTICTGGSVALTASVAGGSGSVTYQWQYQDNNGNWLNVSGWSGTSSTPFTNTRTASPSQTRPYRIVVTSTIDAQCSVTASQLITVVADPVFTISSTNVSCFGANDGTATAVLTGGLPLNYGINWSSNDGISSNNNPTGDGTLSVSGLFPAEWVINTTASPSYGCYAEASVTITQPALLVASSSSGSILCNGGTTTVTVSATGGTAPYIGTGTFTVTAGTYSYTVTDANGCTSTTSITVSEPTLLTASNTTSNFNGYGVSCNGGANGTITVAAAGGTTPYAATGAYSNLSAGTYSYTVTDANGCTASTSATITEPTQVTASNVTSDFNGYGVSCNTGSNGSITVSASGGVAPYDADDVYSNLSAGTYSYTVTDANGCTASTSATITEPTALTSSAISGQILCFGQSTNVAVSANGGVSPYTGTGNYVEYAGTHSYTITDLNGCTSVATVTISQPDLLVASSSSGSISCFGGSTTVTVTATGGTAPYVNTGNYTVTAGTVRYVIQDANGCTAITTITVTEPTLLEASFTAGTIACFGATAPVTVSATGGTEPYSGTGTFNTPAGATVYTVTDANGCTSSVMVRLSQPTQVRVYGGADQRVYFGYGPLACATMTASASGGTGAITYQWFDDNGNLVSSSESATVCPSATTNYTVIATDANGCTASDVVVVCVTDVRCSAGNSNNYNVQICTRNNRTLCVNASSVPSHLRNGATLGSCSERDCTVSAAREMADETIEQDYSYDKAAGEMLDVQMFPNPTSGYVNISINAPEQVFEIQLFDAMGRLVNSVKNQSADRNIVLNLTDLPSGVYMVRISGETGFIVKQIVRE